MKKLIFSEKVRFSGIVLFKDGVSPISLRIDDIRNLKKSESKTELCKIIGIMGF